jgi:hypothetical protein
VAKRDRKEPAESKQEPVTALVKKEVDALTTAEVAELVDLASNAEPESVGVIEPSVGGS